ncbi:MAG: TonB-dependent receptor [Candidatus Baltobacteraceae bacterium]
MLLRSELKAGFFAMVRFFVLLVAMLVPFSAAASAQTQGGAIGGVVVDAASGLPLGGATVGLARPGAARVATDESGKFTLQSVPPGIHQLEIRLHGYQSALSDQIDVLAGQAANVTLSLQRQQIGGQTLSEIGHTSVRASESLQHSSTIYKTQSIESIERQGYYRVGDYLRSLPQVNLSAATGGSDTPSPGDDLYLDIRGIGGLETVALLDGHPIGFGVNRGKNLGYNFEISPTFALRSVNVNFGSGSEGLGGYSAVGGVVDMLTIDPGPRYRFNLTQGFGTFDKLVTTLNASGPLSKRLGFAVAAGTQSLDGPYKNLYLYQPASAFDPSAPSGSPVHQLGIYKDDTTVVNRGDFLKLRYEFGNPQKLAHLTASALSAYYWDDKTGNGDQDFLPYPTALAIGKSSLAGYSPPSAPLAPPYGPSNPPACGAGTFLGLNPNGAPWGFGPDGKPDGGTNCVTPQQYAKFESGYQGAGPTWQAFSIADYHLKYEQPAGATNLTANVYTNRFFQLYDRSFQLPFVKVPGDNLFTLSPSVNTTGVSVTDELPGTNNDVGVGYSFNNYAYLFKANGAISPSPIVHDDAIFLQDVYRPAHGHYSAYLNASENTSTITHSTVFDPRLALVYNLTKNDVLRVAAGATTVQPYATYIDLPYSPIALGALNGNLNCTGLTTIGQVANPNLQPEKANDAELSFGHRFFGDSQIQATVYNENVNDKIYSDIIPVSGLPGSSIPAAALANFETRINAACGTTGLNGVGVNSQANIGRLLARGIDISGRARVSRHLFFDYDYSTESSALRAADLTLLQNNPILIPGSQLPGVPLHKEQIAADATFGRGIDLRLTQYFVAANNSKNIDAYNYGDVSLNVPAGPGAFNVAVNNVFNQYVQYVGLIGEGRPLPLNQYASAGQYVPYIGTGATEAYGLPFRSVFFTYSFSVK